jgi:hypothetical protein
VVKSESQDAPGYTVDFLVSLGANKTAFVEVRSPGWEGHDLTDAERRAGHAKQAKYSESIHGRFSRPIDIIRTTVQKWWVKFSGKAPSILIISGRLLHQSRGFRIRAAPDGSPPEVHCVRGRTFSRPGIFEYRSGFPFLVDS